MGTRAYLITWNSPVFISYNIQETVSDDSTDHVLTDLNISDLITDLQTLGAPAGAPDSVEVTDPRRPV